MSTLADIKERTQEMMRKTAPRSITPLELGQLLVDMQEIIEMIQTTLQTSLAVLESNDDALVEALLDKVDAVSGKGLSTNDYSNEEKQKLSRLSEQKQADWNETDSSSKAFVKNKPIDVSDFVNDAGYVTASDNVATATKLATSRTLWGQSFDGSGNVSGRITGVPSIAANGVTGIVKEIRQLAGCDWKVTNSAYISVSNTDNVTTFNVLRSLNSTSSGFVYQAGATVPIVGHHYYLKFEAKTTASQLVGMMVGVGHTGEGRFYCTLGTNWGGYDRTLVANDAVGLYAYPDTPERLGEGTEFSFRNVMLFDLTAMFGAGNEPTTQPEFALRLGLASRGDIPYMPCMDTPIPLKNCLSLGGDLLVGGMPLRGNMIDEKTEVVYVDGTEATLSPGKVYQFGTVTDLRITLLEHGRTDVEQEYRFRFTCGQDNMSYTFPWDIKWEIKSGYPMMANGHTYEVSIINGFATFLEFE